MARQQAPQRVLCSMSFPEADPHMTFCFKLHTVMTLIVILQADSIPTSLIQSSPLPLGLADSTKAQTTHAMQM